jgi:protein-disulfide isomerase
VIYGKKAAATVEIYEDYACQECREFAQSVDHRLQSEVQANLAEVRYHPIAVLDSESPNQYSTRAASAALCASDQGDDPFVTYRSTLYGTLDGKPIQPAPGEPGPTNVKLVALGEPMKLTSKNQTTFRRCVLSGQYATLTQQMTDTASKRGVAGPFAVFVNGTRLSHPSAASLFAAIAVADKNGPPPQPSKTPTPTPSSPAPSSTAPATSPSGSPSSSASASPSA